MKGGDNRSALHRSADLFHSRLSDTRQLTSERAPGRWHRRGDSRYSQHTSKKTRLSDPRRSLTLPASSPPHRRRVCGVPPLAGRPSGNPLRAWLPPTPQDELRWTDRLHRNRTPPRPDPPLLRLQPRRLHRVRRLFEHHPCHLQDQPLFERTRLSDSSLRLLIL